jgi:hypothetical protein
MVVKETGELLSEHFVALVHMTHEHGPFEQLLLDIVR